MNNLPLIFCCLLVHAQSHSEVLRVYASTIQIQSTVVVHQHPNTEISSNCSLSSGNQLDVQKHESMSLTRIKIARFRAKLTKDIFINQVPILQMKVWSSNPFEDSIELQCGEHFISISSDATGLIITKPRIMSLSPAAMHLAQFVSSLSFLPDTTTDEKLASVPTLEAVLVVQYSEGLHRSWLDDSTLSQCKLIFKNNQTHLTHPSGQLLSGEITFSSVLSSSQLSNPSRSSVLHCFQNFENTFANELASSSGQESSGSTLLLQTAMATGTNRRFDKTFQRARRLAPVFLETSNKIQTLIRSKTMTRQIFAALIDPILNQIPPMIGGLIAENLMPPVMDMLYPILSDLLMGVFMPPDSLGQMGVIDNLPVGGTPADLPVKGQVTDFLQKIKTGQVVQAFPMFIDVTQQLLTPDFKISPSIGTPIKKRLAAEIAGSVLESDYPDTARLLSQTLASTIRVDTMRTVSRGLITSLTASLALSLTHALSGSLAEKLSASLLSASTQQITRLLTPALTHQLGLTVQRAITRPATSDYMCHFCRSQQLYCEQCENMMTEEHYRDFYTNYYAHFYSQYYTDHYGFEISHWFAEQYMEHHRFGTGMLGSQINTWSEYAKAS